jgi:hypothetical protein
MVGRNFARNGYGQVGNKIIPSHPISATRVTRSAIYNKGIPPAGGVSGLRGISEAGYGQRYPNPMGLAKARVYRPGVSGTSYALKRVSLRDAYINDNPPPGSLRGLADDTPEAVDTGTTYGPNIPGTSPAQQPAASGGFFSTLTSDIGTILASAAATGTTQGALAVSNAITGAATPTASKPSTTTILGTPVSNTILGMSATTVLLLGGGIAAYLYFRK